MCNEIGEFSVLIMLVSRVLSLVIVDVVVAFVLTIVSL